MRIEKKKLKTVVLSLALAGMMWPANAFAQQERGGLLGGYEEPTENLGLFGRGGGLFDGLSLQNFGEDEDDLTLQNFGEAPLGSGWLILMASGAGYAALKSRKKQNTKKK